MQESFGKDFSAMVCYKYQYIHVKDTQWLKFRMSLFFHKSNCSLIMKLLPT